MYQQNILGIINFTMKNKYDTKTSKAKIKVFVFVVVTKENRTLILDGDSPEKVNQYKSLRNTITEK